MPSGTGHNSKWMVRICLVAMVFVRSKDVRSHTTEEYAAPADMAAGIDILTGGPYRLGNAEGD